MLIQKILCPTDLSANSKGGIDYAVSLAREQRAELVIFHVTSFPWESFAYLGDAELLTSETMPRFTVDDLLRDAESKVNAIVRTFFEKEIAGVPWHPRIGLGSIAKEIVHAAMQEKVDIIVMAKRKRGVLRRLFSRSISEQVSREAFCPVLSVCPSQIARPTGERKWPLSGRLLQGSEAY